MKAIRIEQPHQVHLVDLPTPQPGTSDVLIQVQASGICGTDVHILREEYLGDYPVIPGHEFAGVVSAVGAAVTRFQVGDRVAVEPNIACDNCRNCLHNRQNYCLNWQALGVTRPGGMAEYGVAPEKAVFDIGDLPFEHGAFVEPLSCVLHGVERAQVRLADTVAILGAGPIGLLLLQVARLRGAAHVTMVERQPTRAELAVAYGADAVYRDLDDLERDGYDVVIDATGAVPVMVHAIDFARRGGTVLLFGVPPAGAAMTLAPFQLFHKGLTVLSSFTSVRNSYQAVALLQSGQVDAAGLISHRLPLAEFEHGVALMERGLEDVRKVLIQPQA
ncbi:MAG: zinc-dependent alcohol dehydrogenase family protein [Chloroflexi bacterium]|nr:zinc-dependent alcohol dehydrogenase family protein [Chloroflexota bacterium]MBU1751203.1 zinc-dependent alcohol dehydrogenase family protein [Chloroflexota bacterium]